MTLIVAPAPVWKPQPKPARMVKGMESYCSGTGTTLMPWQTENREKDDCPKKEPWMGSREGVLRYTVGVPLGRPPLLLNLM
jgi:hypothetical protein